MTVAGLSEFNIGDTLVDPSQPMPLEPIAVEEPPMSITMPPTTARARPTTAPHGIASHTFCDVLFCEIWAATAESLVSLDESLPRELALAGVVTLSLGVAVLPALIFAITLSSFASRLKGFSMEGMGHDLDAFPFTCDIV